MRGSSRKHSVPTSHGSLSVEERGQGGLPLVLIHGNSSSRQVFRHQLHGPLAERHRLITFDLPGHGESSNAPDPKRSYTRPGLADAAIELLEKLRVTEAIVFGWSLGGHIGIEMVPRFSGMRGLMITGSPPVAYKDMARGFNVSPHTGLMGKQKLSEAAIDMFLEAVYGKAADRFFRAAMIRTDGHFRSTLFEGARAGDGVDQRLVVETSAVPLAVVNGGADRVVKLNYFETISYRNLWERRCHRLDGLGHAPFWEAPDIFDPVLERFLNDVESALPRTHGL